MNGIWFYELFLFKRNFLEKLKEVFRRREAEKLGRTIGEVYR